MNEELMFDPFIEESLSDEEKSCSSLYEENEGIYFDVSTLSEEEKKRYDKFEQKAYEHLEYCIANSSKVMAELEAINPLTTPDLVEDELRVDDGIEELSDIEKAHKKMKSEENEELEDDVPYDCRLNNVKVGYTYKRNLPLVNFEYEVFRYETSEPVIVVDTHFMNKESLGISLPRLEKTLALYDFELSRHDGDYKSVDTIVEACKCLIGTKGMIKQHTRVGQYKNYELLFTEKK